MTPLSAAKRITCEQCLRPLSACICGCITPTAHVVEVVVLQHPLEEHSSKGSARLLQLSLSHSRLVTGEVFTEREMQSFLRDPFEPSAHATPDVKHAILLYPKTAAGQVAPPVLQPEMLRNPSRLRLIVLDGTWRKSRKLLHLNPLLRTLPRLSLNEVPPSRYLIRKAHRANQLSTLEATCFALAQIEGDAERFDPLLRAFDGFVAQQMGYRPDITGGRRPETRFD